MSADSLIEELRRAGVTLTVAGDELRFRAPAGVMTAELKATLAARKTELIEALCQPRVDRAQIGCPWSNLIVRGPGLRPRLVPARRIPVAALECHFHGDDWRPIPDHWRLLRPGSSGE
ncbi:MAG: hypothetical protein HY290_22435 [Planctomycetia bacterium]|nr:hypothetical protein [Planctomycetia bacterium]